MASPNNQQEQGLLVPVKDAAETTARFLQDSSGSEEGGSSAMMTLGIILSIIVGGFLLILIMIYVQLKKQRKEKRQILEEAEDKLLRAMRKIEIDGKSLTLESQIVKEKIFNYEQKQQLIQQKEDLLSKLYGEGKNKKQRGGTGGGKRHSIIQTHKEVDEKELQKIRELFNNTAAPRNGRENLESLSQRNVLRTHSRSSTNQEEDQNVRDRLLQSLRANEKLTGSKIFIDNPKLAKSQTQDDSPNRRVRGRSESSASKRGSRNDFIKLEENTGQLNSSRTRRQNVSGTFEMQPINSARLSGRPNDLIENQKVSSSSFASSNLSAKDQPGEHQQQTQPGAPPTDDNEIVRVKVDLSLGSLSLEDEKLNHFKNSSFIYRRKASIRDSRSYTERYVEVFFRRNIENKRLSVKEIDKLVHNLIHKMLILGEDDPQLKHSVHLPKNMIHHQEMIIAVKDAIKPGLFSMYFRPFNIDIISNYFGSLLLKRRSRQHKDKLKANHKEKMKRMLTKKISADLSLNINSVHHTNQENKTIVKEEEKIKQKLIGQQVGPRVPQNHKVLLDMVAVQKEQEIVEMKKLKQRELITQAVFTRQKSVTQVGDENDLLEILANQSITSQLRGSQILEQGGQLQPEAEAPRSARGYYSDRGQQETAMSRMASQNMKYKKSPRDTSVGDPSMMKTLTNLQKKNLNVDDDYEIFQKIQRNANYSNTMAQKIDLESNKNFTSNISSRLGLVVSDSPSKKRVDQNGYNYFMSSVPNNDTMDKLQTAESAFGIKRPPPLKNQGIRGSVVVGNSSVKQEWRKSPLQMAGDYGSNPAHHISPNDLGLLSSGSSRGSVKIIAGLNPEPDTASALKKPNTGLGSKKILKLPIKKPVNSRSAQNSTQRPSMSRNLAAQGVGTAITTGSGSHTPNLKIKVPNKIQPMPPNQILTKTKPANIKIPKP